MPHDRLAKAEASMRALGYRRQKRRADMKRLNEVETELAGVVRLAGRCRGARDRQRTQWRRLTLPAYDNAHEMAAAIQSH
jgi:hypothetical protein